MEVITERPIYSYLTDEEKALKAQKKKEKAQKRKQTLDNIVQSDYTKATVGALTGVGAQKIQNWAGTGSFGNQSPLQFDPNAFNTQAGVQPTAVDDGRDPNRRSMGVWTKVGIGVGIVAILGIATYFILSSKKGKSAKK